MCFITGSGSLPARERGLKYTMIHELKTLPESLPARERGLKLLMDYDESNPDGRSLRGSVD